jgi:abortive infection bacteriophage resistance protein
VNPEVYRTGTTFEEIYSLFSFDRELRMIILKDLLKFESNIKSKVSYRFSEKYTEANAYLQMGNYSRDPSQLKQVLKLIATISNEISKQSVRGNAVAHYLDRHDGVPLWVLVNYLTLGNIQNFYMCLNDPIKNTIAKDFADYYNRDYGASVHFTSDMLINILKIATLFRNVCAHEERLYNFRLNRPARSADISTAIGIPVTLLNTGNLFAMVSFLKLVMSKQEHRILVRQLKGLFSKYSTEFTSVNFQVILDHMGFITNWEQYF